MVAETRALGTKAREVIAGEEKSEARWQLLRVALAASEIDPEEIQWIRKGDNCLFGLRIDGSRFSVPLPAW